MYIQIGFKTRPLRDGGGKPSIGRLIPPNRPSSPLTLLGQRILEATSDSGLVLRPGASLQQSPFSPDFLSELRRQSWLVASDILTNKTGTSGPDFSEVEVLAAGQPYYLKLVELLLLSSNDPDAHFPPSLEEGVPLGVEEETLDSSHVWPTKEEMTGGESTSLLLDVEAHSNYSSAIIHEDVIEQTVMEELSLELVAGPFSATEAADYCGCR